MEIDHEIAMFGHKRIPSHEGEIEVVVEEPATRMIERGHNVMPDQKNTSVKHIFVIGCKSIGLYGGYETFVDKLTEQHQNDLSIKYHVACKANGEGFMDESKLDGVENTMINSDGTVVEFTYHNAHVFKIPCLNIGSSAAIYYDRTAVKYSIRYCKDNHIESHEVLLYSIVLCCYLCN